MENNIDIYIKNTELGTTNNVSTSGYLLLYLDGETIKMDGKMSLKAIAPILTKIALEKFTK